MVLRTLTLVLQIPLGAFTNVVRRRKKRVGGSRLRTNPTSRRWRPHGPGLRVQPAQEAPRPQSTTPALPSSRIPSALETNESARVASTACVNEPPLENAKR
jgi:hypothetical protein